MRSQEEPGWPRRSQEELGGTWKDRDVIHRTMRGKEELGGARGSLGGLVGPLARLARPDGIPVWKGKMISPLKKSIKTLEKKMFGEIYTPKNGMYLYFLCFGPVAVPKFD